MIVNSVNEIFNKHLELGLRGELLVEKAIDSNPFLSIKEDVRYNRFFQTLDIDYLINIHSLEGTISSSLEVKSDYKHKYTGNMFFQELSNVDTGRLGDIFRTEAEYIAYVFVPEEKIWLFKTKELQDWLLKNAYRFKRISNAGAYKRTCGWIISSRFFFDEKIGYKGYKIPLRLPNIFRR